MIHVGLLLVLAAVAFAIRRVTFIPLIPLMLLAGMGLRAVNLALDEEIARGALDFGLSILVFSAGMELNPKRFGGQFRSVTLIGLAQFLFIGAGGVVIALALGQSALTALYIGLAISTSSTLIIVRLLKSRQQMFEPFGRIVTGVLLIQDLLIIIMIVVLIRLPGGMDELLHGIGGLVILIGCSFAGLRYVMPYLVMRMKLDMETLGLAILAVLFVFMGLAHLLKLPIITGAFLAGVSLSAFPVNSIARGLMGSITAFCMALFFIVLGGLITLPSANEWLLVATLSFFIIVGTPLIAGWVGVKSGLTARASIESGLLLAMTSEFSLLVALQGYFSAQIAPEMFNVIAITTVITMSLTPILATDRLTWKIMNWLPGTAPRELKDADHLRDHIVMLGYGKGSSVVLKALQKQGHDVVIVNDDPIVVRDLLDQGIRAVYGDGPDPRVLDLVHAKRARLIISAMRRVTDARKVMKTVGPNGPKLIMRVFEPEDAEQIEKLGGIPVLSSEAAADAFMKWHDQLFGEGTPVEVDS